MFSNEHSHSSLHFPSTTPELIAYLTKALTRCVDGPYTFDQLRTLESLKILIEQLKKCNQSSLIFALLWCKLQFHIASKGDAFSLEESRGFACEIAAMRIVRMYNADEVLTVLTSDFEALGETLNSINDESQLVLGSVSHLNRARTMGFRPHTPTQSSNLFQPSSPRHIAPEDRERSPLLPTMTSALNVVGSCTFTAMEVAIVAEAKHFTASAIVQEIFSEIYNGNIVFWSDLSSSEFKRARYYEPTEDNFWNWARLRVPRYSMCIDSFNCFILLCLYLFVVVGREYKSIGSVEVVLAVWFMGLIYEEWDQWRESSTTQFYLSNPWNFFDLGMIAVALSWMLLRIIGIARGDTQVVGYSYDVLSLQALFLIPRLFSFLSLSPYFGTLIPCLKKMGVDFFKFMLLVVAMYLGFLITFSVLGRNDFTVSALSWMLVRIFFGSSYLGFDSGHLIHPFFGPPLMLIFVTFTSLILTTSLISILSNSFSTVMQNAREEYLFLFATTCAEGSKSDHIVVLHAPFNIVSLLFVRPLRLFFTSNHPRPRSVKLALLKITHWPYMLIVALYERSFFNVNDNKALQRKFGKGQVNKSDSFRFDRNGGNRSFVQESTQNIHSSRTTITPCESDHDTDEEDAIDTGRMLDPSTNSSGIANFTKERLSQMEMELREIKALLREVVKKV